MRRGLPRNEQIRRIRTLRRPRARRAGPAERGRASRPARGRDRARRSAQSGGQRRGDETLRLRQAGYRRRAAGRPISRRAVPDEGPHLIHRWRENDTRLQVLRRYAASGRRQRAREAVEARGARHLRADQHLRAGPLAYLRASASWPDAQPLGRDSHLGRFERRGRCSRRRENAPAGTRLRWLRLDPRSGRVLRRGGPQADAQPKHLRSVFRRRSRRPVDRACREPQPPRQCRAAGCDVWARPRRSLRCAAARGSLSQGSRRGSRKASHRLDCCDTERRQGGSRSAARAGGNGRALHRPGSPRRGAQPRYRGRCGGADFSDVCLCDHGREPREPSNRGTAGARGRGRADHLADGEAGRECECRRLSAGHADCASPRDVRWRHSTPSGMCC